MNELRDRNEAIGEQLRAKISSKFQTSTFLAGFNFAVLGLQITLLWQPKSPYFLSLSIPIMLLSIILYIAAVIELDGLTMPKRFWDEDVRKETNEPYKEKRELLAGYLEKEDLWNLKNLMVFYWYKLTIMATILSGISLFIILLPLPPRDFSIDLIRDTFVYALIFTVIAIAYVAYLYLSIKNRENFKPLKRHPD